MPFKQEKRERYPYAVPFYEVIVKKKDIEAYADQLLSGHEISFSSATLDEFKNTPKKDLIKYHDTLGKSVRNVFQLWNVSWKPKIVDGVDESPNHPDQVSMAIIEIAWTKLQKK